MSTAGDAEAFLRAYHARDPGATRRAVARGRVVGTDGSSYQLLAALAPPGARVLDLACGDGPVLDALVAAGHDPARLIGVDVSAEELAAAITAAPRLRARADALPLATASIDACVSHLALMLMPDLDPVIAELRRVLRPGGRLAAVIGGGPGLGDAFERFAELAQPLLRTPPLTDRRLRRADGIAAAFAPLGAVTQRDLDVDLAGPIDAVWSTVSAHYGLAGASATDLLLLRTAFATSVADLAVDGVVPCTMHLRLVEVAEVGTGGAAG